MKNLKEVLREAENRGVAVGHFNFSTLDQFGAITEAALELQAPVILGLSEGERDFIGIDFARAIVERLRKKNRPVFLNADHTYSLQRVREAAEAGFDSVIFDGAAEVFEENLERTRNAVRTVRKVKRTVLVEGEIGYIGRSSAILKGLPEGAAISEKDLPKPEEAEIFVRETGIDLLAPAVGNVHGMFKNAPNPRLNIDRIREIKKVTRIPLVLHGGSGTVDEDFVAAIEAGISVIHVSTELRLVWRTGLEEAFFRQPEEVAPYKLLQKARLSMKGVVEKRLKLFSKFVRV